MWVGVCVFLRRVLVGLVFVMWWGCVFDLGGSRVLVVDCLVWAIWFLILVRGVICGLWV